MTIYHRSSGKLLKILRKQLLQRWRPILDSELLSVRKNSANTLLESNFSGSYAKNQCAPGVLSSQFPCFTEKFVSERLFHFLLHHLCNKFPKWFYLPGLRNSEIDLYTQR